MHPPSAATCHAPHDPSSFYLSLFISLGLLVSYIPQHARIVYYKTSEGIDPTFLLLGATSGASSVLNVLALSWASVRCCVFLTRSSCLESLMGVVQIGLQWACFGIVFILFLAYYPETSKYVSWVPGEAPPPRQSQFWKNVKRAFRPANFSGAEEVQTPDSEDSEFDFSASVAHAHAYGSGNRSGNTAKVALSEEWRKSTTYAGVALAHLAICAFVTFLLLLTLPKASQPPLENDPDALPGVHEESRDARVVRYWATFLGIMSTILAMFQYIIKRTWERKLVGSLSIPMMLIQTPGSFVFVYSIMIRLGANWTTWLVFLITGLLQGILLGMCIAWTLRQRRLGIDAYGKPLDGSAPQTSNERRPLLRP